MKLILTSLFLIFVLNVNGQNSKDDPIETFETLWSEFNLRYANFELKAINWQSIYNHYRPQINATSTKDEVFDICCKMLQELKDGHVNLEGKTETKDRTCASPVTYSIYNEFGSFENLLPLVHKTLDKESFSPLSKKTGKGLIRFATSKHYGYLSILEFEGFAIGELNRSIKKALKQFKDKKGVIIDVRLNGGGDDKAAYKIAGRFADKTRLGHYKKTRIKGTENFTPLESWFLEPKGKNQFTKPIIILTSDWSASATEVFLLAMRELPYVQVVGDSTEGIFSDMFEFNLSNGWYVSLSHQQFFSSKMVNYEGKGITPDFKILNYKKDEFDTVLLKAIALLDKATAE